MQKFMLQIFLSYDIIQKCGIEYNRHSNHKVLKMYKKSNLVEIEKYSVSMLILLVPYMNNLNFALLYLNIEFIPAQ